MLSCLAISRYLAVKHLAVRLFGNMAIWLHGFIAKTASRDKVRSVGILVFGRKVLGFLASWFLGCLVSWFLGFLVS